MEGAVWMAQKISNEIEKICKGIDSLIFEFNQRTSTETIGNCLNKYKVN